MKDTTCFDELILLMTFGFNAEEKRCEIIELISKHYNIDVYNDEDVYDGMLSLSRARSTKQYVTKAKKLVELCETRQKCYITEIHFTLTDNTQKIERIVSKDKEKHERKIDALIEYYSAFELFKTIRLENVK
jgi:triacylglycerol esterase/lipase EstA (alpha/beta hydrolase family)